MRKNGKRVLCFIVSIAMFFEMADGTRWKLQGKPVEVQAAVGSILMEDSIRNDAAEPALVNEEEVYGGYVNLSDQVIQEGGYLSEPYSQNEGKGMLSEEENSEKRQVQEALTAAWDSVSDTCDLSAYQVTQEDLKEIYSETLNKHPGYFYVSGGYSYYSSNGFVTQLMISYHMEKAQALEMRKDYDTVVSKIISNADESWTDMEKALYINDYLARNCAYDTSYSKLYRLPCTG